MTGDDIKCETCRWWDGEGGGGRFGACRRHAPRPAVALTKEQYDHVDEVEGWAVVAWPMVSADEVCGEHRWMLKQ